MPQTIENLEKIQKAVGRKLKLVALNDIMKWENSGSYAVDENKEIIGLNLYKFNLTDLSFLKHVPNLMQLDLSSNRISDISFLKYVPNLTQLDLSSNRISDYSSLRYVPNLIQLDFYNNQISNLSFLEYVSKLTQLNLSGNQILDITFLKHVPNLTQLSLSNNQISDYSFLKYVPNLTQLSLSNNQISDISYLKHVPNLTQLSLSNNQISDISYLKHVPNLTQLSLSNNQISDISVLIFLVHLETIDLGNNKISELPQEIAELYQEINLERHIYVEGLNLYGNPIKTPPLEIVKKGRDAVLAYFKSLEEGEKQALNEVKVLLVGDGGSGKTSLMKQLFGEKFDEKEPQTHGINIKSWNVETENKTIKVNLWDFGGQEIMHATHQFFLSKRSMYILILDGRKEEDAEYWLKLIESFGGNSPILIVLNKIDQNPGFDVNRRFLKEKYEGISDFCRISCAKGEGIPEFLNSLKKAILKVGILETTWAKNWFDIKMLLEDMKKKLQKNYISCGEYKTYCQEKNIDEQSAQDTLVGFLHDLGVVIHFKDIRLLNMYVLEPKWVTEAVYKIINSPITADSKGILKLYHLDSILQKKEKNDYEYPSGKFSYIIELMLKFELCYELDSQTILIPNLLEKQEPQIDFNYDDSLKFIIEYDFLPKSVMPKFIVKMHKDIKYDFRWRTGVVLEDKSFKSTAVIKADERDKKIFIYVGGDQRRYYFSVIRKTFKDINGSFEKLLVKEWVPLPDNKEIAVEYEELIGYERGHREEIFIGKLNKAYSVSELLNGIEMPEQRKKIKEGAEGIEKPRENLTIQTFVNVPPAEKDKSKWKNKYVIIGLIFGFVSALWGGSQFYEYLKKKINNPAKKINEQIIDSTKVDSTQNKTFNK